MSEVPTNPSDRSSQSGVSDGANGQPDPLATLHRMSRTAGLGTQEYVAVNATAVTSLLLGFASLMAVLGAILLVIPAAAIIVGVVAIIQVRRSAGTQTGTRIAILGMVLAVLCVGLAGGRKYMHNREILREQGEIISLIEDLGKNISQGNYDAAWDKFSKTVHNNFRKEDFADYWTRVQAYPGYGKVTSMQWNRFLDVSLDPETGAKLAHGVVIINVDGSGNKTDRRDATFRKLETGRWVVEGMGIDFSPVQMGPARPN